MNWELILKIAAVVVPILAAAPGIYAIRKQIIMEQVEKKKLVVEAESISADVAAKFIDSAGDLQEFYKEVFGEIKQQLEEYKEIVCRLEEKVEDLERGIRILTKQVQDLGENPKYPNGKEE
jgi:DNA-binding transcriptional regulator GbsR (MarR family)